MSYNVTFAMQAISAFNNLISPPQRAALVEVLRGEEGKGMAQNLLELSDVVGAMPKSYETDNQGQEAVAYLHYFLNGYDAYITELDISGEPYHQCFGWVDMGYGGELGYVSLPELLRNNVELDLYWTPKTLREIIAEKKR